MLADNRLVEALDRPEPTMAVTFANVMSGTKIATIARIADVAELRADLVPMDAIYSQVKKLARLPLLLTVRTQSEGGEWKDNESQRLGLFIAMMQHWGIDGVDIELAAEILPRVIDAAHEQGKTVIASSHDFVSTPSLGQLEDSLGRSTEAGADYFKVAATARTDENYSTLQDFTADHKDDNVIVMAMDPEAGPKSSDQVPESEKFGARSRIELPGLGSHLTYASTGEEAVARGQMSYLVTHERLKRAYPAYKALFSY